MSQLQASAPDENRYRLLIDSITDYAIYMLDPDGVVTSWNSGAARFKGYRAEEVLGRHFSIFYSAEDQAAGRPLIALQSAQAEGRFESEGWRVRKDGSQFWAHVVIDPIRAPDGELLGFAKITRDLTERRQADLALRDTQEQFRRLVQGVTDYAIYMLDPTGHVTNWNAGAQRIKGYRPQEIIGSHFSHFYTEEDRQAGVPEMGLATAAREGRWEQEGWRVRKTGERFWAHVVLDAIRDDDGVLIGFAKVTRDITERRETQRQLDEAREALLQSQKLEAIGQLTGGVAHDFNNLLMAVLGSLELVRKRLPYDPKITPLLYNAIQGAERGAQLTKRMLAFARKQELALQAIDLPQLVEGMLDLLSSSLGPGISIVSDFAPDLPAVRTDPVQLENALLNLAINARDAMPDGGVITITATPATAASDGEHGLAAGDYVRLTISDTGEGMSEAVLARAAEPFFTTKGLGKGTGLGLSMVHGLAAQSGGRLALSSPPGEGLTVDIWLPTAMGRTTAAEGEAPIRVAGGRERLRILAVDDDALVLLNTAAMLEDLGHRVIAVESGEAALAAMRQGAPFDLVITDQAMPGMTGLQLRAAVRKHRPELKVLIATGYAEMPEDSEGALRLAKPFNQMQLAAAVAAAVPAERDGA